MGKTLIDYSILDSDAPFLDHHVSPIPIDFHA